MEIEASKPNLQGYSSPELVYRDQNEESFSDETHQTVFSDLWPDLDALLESAMKKEEAEKAEKVDMEFEILKKDSQEGKRPQNYNKADNQTKLKIITLLEIYSKMSKDERKVRKIDKRNRFYSILEKKFHVNARTIGDWHRKSQKQKYDMKEKLEDVCQSKRGRNSKGHVYQRVSSGKTYSTETERKLISWIEGCWEMGVLITLAILRKKARQLILPESPQFKASYKWAKSFLRRNNLSLKLTTTKLKKPEKEEDHIKEEFLQQARRLINQYQIHPRYILNMDETPLYWEYLPRKIVHKKGSKVVPSIKTGFEYKRSTLTLTCSAYGDLLRPALIIKRKRPYELGCRNKIKLLLQKSHNGWQNVETMKEWFEEIFLPYVGENECLLILDSFEGHKCKEIRVFLKPFKNIHLLVVPGGSTDLLQPLDMGINSAFKAYCKSIALDFINKKMEVLYNERKISDFPRNRIDLTFLADEDDLMVIMEKDLNRKRNSSQRRPGIKIELKDIYDWIESAYQEIKKRPSIVFNCFQKIGIGESFWLDSESKEEELPDLSEVSLDFSEVSDVNSSNDSSEDGDEEEEESEGSEGSESESESEEQSESGSQSGSRGESESDGNESDQSDLVFNVAAKNFEEKERALFRQKMRDLIEDEEEAESQKHMNQSINKGRQQRQIENFKSTLGAVSQDSDFWTYQKQLDFHCNCDQCLKENKNS